MAHLDPDVITAYIDVELPPEEMAAVEAHLAACNTCRAEYEDIRGVAMLVRQLPAYRPQREIEIDARAGNGPAAMERIVEFSKPLALAAIILLVAFAGLRLIGTIGDDDAAQDEQSPFPAAQQTPVDGTEPAGSALRTVTAGADSPAGAGGPPESDSASSANTMQAVAPELSATAPAAASARVATPETPDGGGPSLAMIAATTVAVLAIAGSVAWHTLRRPPRRRRSQAERIETNHTGGPST